MFTGLIEDVGNVVRLERAGAGARLVASCALPFDGIRIGDSVAVNGACLTVVEKTAGNISFDVSPETVARTTLGKLRPGDNVNLERALCLGDRLGGHLVSGHVDCIAVMCASREESANRIISFRLPGTYSRYLIEKGSVAIDGISLTVNEVRGDVFSVNIIPHTAHETTLHLRRPGDEVNIETDLIGKYVERLLGPAGERGRNDISMELLAKNGFL
jgi:riboflavin synthase